MNHKSIITLLSAILAVILIFGIILISTFNQGLSELKNEMMNINSSISGQIGNLSAYLDSMTLSTQTMLDEQESLIAGYSIAYNDPNAQTLKCDVSVTVTPKEYSADTTAVLYIDDKKVPMTQSGNAYATSLSVSLSEVSEASVTFQQGGINQTEILPETIGTGNSLPYSLTVEPMIDWFFQDNTVSIDGAIQMSFHSDFKDSVKSARFVAITSDKEIWSENITKDQLADDIPYANEIWFSHTFENVENDDAISIYAEIVGSSGFTYRKTIYGSKETDISGVYDANGNLIEFEDDTEY